MIPIEHKINVMLSGIVYHVASLSVNETKQEIFYSPKSNNKDYGWDLNQDKQAGTIDHFSFHKNGQVHEKFKAINRDTKNRNKMSLYQKLGSFLGSVPSASDKVRHIAIDSIYQVNDTWSLSSIASSSEYICALDCNQFSLVLVLMHSSSFARDILHCDGVVQSQLQINEYPLEIPVYDNWKIVVYVTWQTLPRIHSKGLALYNLSFRAGNEQEFNRSIVIPPTPKAYQHLGFGRSIILPETIKDH